MTSADVDERARAVLRANDRGGYTVPCTGLYPFQWNWDSAFAAWGWSTFDGDRAWTELETLFVGQWETGMLPHIVFHRHDAGYFPGPEVWRTRTSPPTSGITQPPVVAILARKMLDDDPTLGRARLAKLYPKLLAMHRWWHTVRCREGVAAIVHPWESGRDNAAAWDVGLANVDVSGVEPFVRRDTGHVDASMRPRRLDYDRYVAIVESGRNLGWDHDRIVEQGPFLMADPAITFILARAHRDLAALGNLLGEDTGDLERWADVLVAGAAQLWNAELGAYDSLDLRTGIGGGSATASVWLEYLAGIGDEHTDAHLDAVMDRVAFGLPTHDPASTDFEPRRYWRGPTWPFLNCLVALGLQSAGRRERADSMRSRTAALIERGGFAEYFDPTDATACGGADFSWTAAVWLAWARSELGGYGADS